MSAMFAPLTATSIGVGVPKLMIRDDIGRLERESDSGHLLAERMRSRSFNDSTEMRDPGVRATRRSPLPARATIGRPR